MQFSMLLRMLAVVAEGRDCEEPMTTMERLVLWDAESMRLVKAYAARPGFYLTPRGVDVLKTRKITLEA
jgi:hypothetical protein